MNDNYKSIMRSDCTFTGNNYRVTILTERLVRLEYSINNEFNDNKTYLVNNRNFNKPEFEVNEDNKVLNIKTNYFTLRYLKGKKFSSGKLVPYKNLKITLNNGNYWYYNHPEAKNFKVNNKKSLYSLDGFSTLDDSNGISILENNALKNIDSKNIDIYVFLYGNDFIHCLNDYYELTGYPPMVPRYILGNWWEKNENYAPYELENFINDFKNNNIPISIFQLVNNDKLDSCDGNFINDINILHKNNIYTSINIKNVDSFDKTSLLFERLKEQVNVNTIESIPFNVYDSWFIDTYLKLIIRPLNKIGVDFYNYDDSFKDINKLNILKYYLNDESKRYISCSKINFYASHRYPIQYYGKTDVSWDSLKLIPFFNSSLFNMGLSFVAHDFGGTNGGLEDSELYIRYIELGVFSPIMKLASDKGKYYKREPWKWDLKTNMITTRYLNLRYKLITYLYTETYKYHKYGKPLIEPLYYSNKDLIDDVNYKNEYYLGSSFLISPIISKKDVVMDRVIQRFFLPEGIWYDYFKGKKYKGGRYVSFYKDDEYPVFVREGSIIPLSCNKYNDISLPNNLLIDIFPGKSNTYSIYEDDGITNNYLNDDFTITNIEYIYNRNNYKVTILPVGGKNNILPKLRNYKIVFRKTKASVSVSSFVNDKRINNKVYKDNLNLVVEVYNVPTNAQLTIICSGNNIELSDMEIINEDITSIINDLPIKTVMKEKIDSIMFSDLPIDKKRIKIRRLANGKVYLERKYIELFIKLLEYISKV